MRRFGCDSPTSEWKGRWWEWVWEGIWRGRVHQDGRHPCQRWFAGRQPGGHVRRELDEHESSTYTAFFYGGGLGAQDELLSGGGEFSKTSDRQVFVVEVGILTDDVVGLGRRSE